MNCLKCGTETENDQVFCHSCRAVMAQNPVKPGTPVHIPNRNAPVPEKRKSRRKSLNPKEIIRQMRSMIRWLSVVIALLTAIICMLVGILLYTLDTTPSPNNIGKNYITENTTQSD